MEAFFSGFFGVACFAVFLTVGSAGEDFLAVAFRGVDSLAFSFDVDYFLDSPAFSTAEFKIGEERILVVEPL